ncbi:N-acetyltransferase family protein [Jannaschia sp. KMU-145]|uniref:GNAT family N-acetyltransferase n=1 Tax=Jannaschia halovivens TaxID=3388667 RepID=UPI00396B2B79
MSGLHVRPARPFDGGAMADLLNEIIRIGGTTAIEGPVTGDELRGWLADAAAWHVAEDAGEIVGFQWVEHRPDLPADAVSIATFARPGRQGLGIGTKLFEATRAAALAAGIRTIHAVIADYNDSGRAYYRSRGFERIAGAPEGKVVKLFRLR